MTGEAFPREEQVVVTVGDSRRVYCVWYAEDPPARRAAVELFQRGAHLIPSFDVPAAVERMPLVDANEYLKRNPLPRLWELLIIEPESVIVDDSFQKIGHLPELRFVQIMGNELSDAAVENLCSLEALETLILSSERVTDACLSSIRRIRSLRYLDLQGCSGMSAAAVTEASRSLPNICEVWPPTLR